MTQVHVSAGGFDYGLIIHLVYGLSFFVLGLVVSLRVQGFSRYRFSAALGSLAAFGFLHALTDWGPLLIHGYRPEGVGALAYLGGRALIRAVSFALLLRFGLVLAFPPRRSGYQVEIAGAVPALLTVTWLVGLVLYPVYTPNPEPVTWLRAADVWSRYLLGLPAGLAAAWGLHATAAELRRDNLHHHVRALYLLAVCFALYGLFAGLLVPPYSFSPASWLNATRFEAFTGVPVEVIRGLLGLGIAYFTHRLMGVFRIEAERRLRQAEEEQAVLRERERIARDLHDGIIQTLYGTGLGLQQVAAQLEDDPAGSRRAAEALSRELARAIADLRHYILDLRDEGGTMAELAQRIRLLCRQVQQFTGLEVRLQVEGFEDETDLVQLPPGLISQVVALLREGLSNVVRHAQCHSAGVMVAVEEDTLLLRITDQGQGFDPHCFRDGQAECGTGHGLRNMRERVLQSGGLMQIESRPGAGTRILIHLPLNAGDRRTSADYGADRLAAAGRRM